ELDVAEQLMKASFLRQRFDRLARKPTRRAEITLLCSEHGLIVLIVRRIHLEERGDRGRIALFAELPARAELGQKPSILCDAFGRGRMRGEQTLEPALLAIALLGEADEGFLQRHGPRRIVAGGLHIAHAVLIGFELLLATVLRLNELRADASTLQDEPRNVPIDIADCRTDLRKREPSLHQRAAFLRLRAVTRGGVHDFMS